MTKYKLIIEGMNCEGCVRTVKGTIENLGGKNVQVSLEGGYAEFELENGDVNIIKENINKRGFEVKEVMKI